MTLEELCAASKAAWDQGDYPGAAAHHAAARELVWKDDPHSTVAQLGDGRLAVVAHEEFAKKTVEHVHSELAAKLDAK